ncbi:toxin TcdB middle/N-terminal domain-containing protein [Pelagibius sp. CAU 1746]|uniref:toxin TcdB middle/N-terminal domain-containing protein n=1 Tax=Pelagibius sp. CAU 1746 TaxID=3140370 RepID=UPI00325B7CDA
MLLAAGSLQSAQAQATVAGVTSGALSVDETGSAGYTIPIAVPPGIAGMQPSLALVYQSHGGNGTAGVGWGLSASSSIHRCSQTLAQDGAIHGVDFSADDRFCLDGQRLVAISGAYGANGTEYRTEIDSFARIVSHGTAGTGPLSFTVETKSGRTLEYGNTADARLGVAAASEIRLWSLNKVSDTLGNAMTYHYVEGAADSSYRLDRIEYTSNAGQSVLPQSEVRFVYEARPDVRTSYLAGAKLAMTKRLAAVETWSGSGTGLALVKRYSLTYETSPATSRSRLTAITECDANSNCLQPVNLGWLGEVPDFDTTVIASDTVTNLWGLSRNDWAANTRELHMLDYNGDGLSDILLQGVDENRFNYLLTHSGPAPDLLTSITDSLGRTSTLDYAPLTDATVYAKDSDAVFPVVDIQAPLYVVKSVSSDDGVGGQKVTSYSYAGAKVHVQGRGFRGFRQMTATDQQTGIVTTTDYSQVFPTTAQVLTSVKTLTDGTTIKTIANTWDQLSLNTGKTVWPYVASSTSKDYEPNDGVGNLPVVSRTATAVFDVYGDPTNLTTTTTGGGETFTETTVNSYQNIATPTRWLPGLVTRSEVTRSRPGGP